MSEIEFPAAEAPDDADALFALLASEVPALAEVLSQMTAPGAAIDFGPISDALDGLSTADRHRVEQLFASFNNGAIRTQVAELAAGVTDEMILAAALTVHPHHDGPVAVSPSILGALGVLLAAARVLTADASNVGALRVLLAAGYADTLLSVDADTLVRGLDPLSLQMSVSPLADQFIDVVAEPAAQLTEIFTQRPDAEVQFNLAALNDATNTVFVELLKFYPEVVEHFDALLAAHVGVAADSLNPPGTR